MCLGLTKPRANLYNAAHWMKHSQPRLTCLRLGSDCPNVMGWRGFFFFFIHLWQKKPNQLFSGIAMRGNYLQYFQVSRCTCAVLLQPRCPGKEYIYAEMWKIYFVALCKSQVCCSMPKLCQVSGSPLHPCVVFMVNGIPWGCEYLSLTFPLFLHPTVSPLRLSGVVGRKSVSKLNLFVSSAGRHYIMWVE